MPLHQPLRALPAEQQTDAVAHYWHELMTGDPCSNFLGASRSLAWAPCVGSPFSA